MGTPAFGAETFDVAIIGFGPSGAVAAGLLGGFGLRTFVCDRSRGVYDKPRAIALDHEILRVFQQLGVLDAVLPHTEPFTDSRYLGVGGEPIKCLSTIAPPYPLGFAPASVFSQPPVEAALRAHAESLPGVEVALGLTLRAMAQDAGGVTLFLRDGEGDGGGDGAERRVRARCLIGCDGASSTVRECAAIALDDLQFDEPWLVVDVRVDERGLAKLPTTSVQYCEPARPCSFLIGPGNHRRWEIALNEGDDPRRMATDAGTWQLLSRWLTPADGRLWRQASYRFHALVAHEWRRGRVFLAGDAAHQQPPFLGQGMCQGIRDVANLAWKLEAVLRGRAGDALLDTYGAERGLHVRQLTERIKAIGALICERDPARARERDARLIREAGGRIEPTPRQDVMPPLAAGLLDGSGHGAVGSIFPQPWVDDRGGRPVRLDDVAGTGWRLVVAATAELPALPPAAVRRLELTVVRIGACDRPGTWREADGVAAAWFRRHGCAAALVRPDHRVYGVGADGDDLSPMLLALAGWLAPAEAGEGEAARPTARDAPVEPSRALSQRRAADPPETT